MPRLRFSYGQRRMIQQMKTNRPSMTLRCLQTWVMKQFKLKTLPAKSTIFSILQASRQPDPNQLEANETAKRKLTVRHLQLEVNLMKWINFADTKGFFINQRIIRIQAARFARDIGASLKLSNGWLQHHCKLVEAHCDSCFRRRPSMVGRD